MALILGMLIGAIIGCIGMKSRADYLTIASTASDCTHTINLVVLLLFTGCAFTAAAQGTRYLDTATDCLQTAARAKKSADCEPKEVTISSETEMKFSIETPALKSPDCATTIGVEYTQRDTMARVTGMIENQDCAASSGEYQLSLIVRDENLARRTLEFVQSWQRDDDQPVEFKADYPIGGNVDLISVRATSLHCTCSGTTGATKGPE